MRLRRQTVPEYFISMNDQDNRHVLPTKPFMQLTDPRCTSMFDWRIQEDDLVLDSDLVDYGS